MDILSIECQEPFESVAESTMTETTVTELGM